MRLLLLRALAQASHAPQVADHVLRLAEVDLLQEVPHLEFHVLDELPDVGDLLLVALRRQLDLDLARHVAREVHIPEVVRVRR